MVGFCAAALAFGRVASVLQSIESLLAVMGPHPAAFVRAFDPVRDSARIEPLVHRWIRGRDLVALLLVLQRMLRESGSIENFFLEGDDPSAPDIGPALDSFSSRALADRPARRLRPPRADAGAGVCYFFPRPSAGSACKRLNLFLRWMVRNDAIDLGVWTKVSPARLIVPLDTHVIRLGRCLRLTRYISPGWKMAAEITASLRALDPKDPVRYDFSLCHVGHDERLRLQPAAEGLAVSAAGRLPTRRSYTAAVPATIRSTVKRFARAAQRRLAHARAQRLVLQQQHELLGHRLVIARRHQEAGLAVHHHLGNAAGRRGTAAFDAAIASTSAVHMPSLDRAHREDVEALRQLEDVGAEAGEEHVPLEMLVLDLLLQRSRSSPSPTITKRTSGTSRTTSAAASIRWCCPLCGTSAATLPTTGACVGR